MSPAPPAAARSRDGFREWLRAILWAVVLWLTIRTFLVEAFRIPSGSMESTLLPGDMLFVNKAVYGPVVPGLGIRLPAWREPVRGDVLIFDSVEQPGEKIVKRLVGLPGDTLVMRAGVLFRNGQVAAEPFVRHQDLARSESTETRRRMRLWQERYLVGDSMHYAPDLQDWGPIVVPSDALFVLGDNRDVSYDGRFWGFLPRANVRGTPLWVYFSYDPETGARLPQFFAIRWHRLGTRPR